MYIIKSKRILFLSLIFLSALFLCFLLSGCTDIDTVAEDNDIPFSVAISKLDPNGAYDSPDDVALFIHQYKKLPANYITKEEAQAAGWISSTGNLWEVAGQVSIGGDVFFNREGNLPQKNGRIWYECDVNYQGGYRGGERIVYSNDGLIFYTGDHYQTFFEYSFAQRGDRY